MTIEGSHSGTVAIVERARTSIGLKITATAMAVGLLAACATPAPPPVAPPPPPPPPPPPAPVVERIPYRPLPPGGAAYVMNIPPVGPDGLHLTINRRLTEDELVWHFRSGWNVAALNCTAPQFQPILDGYSAYIKDHAPAMKRINDRIDRDYRRNASSRREAIRNREAQFTSVYNFWALPPVRAGFCNAALDISNRALAAPPADPVAFARDNFVQLEAPFERFFEEYQTYRNLSAQWDAQYGERYGPSQPGWVAVQRAKARGVVIPTVGESAAGDILANPTPSDTVIDSETGEEVPVVPVDTNTVSQPVTQPLPSDPDDG